ncbi:MAG: hypothetical protein QOI98_1603, partial [Solirubrobacteraceae bacterium]|nr:hypothetical protein [Solirubrobacteraceae bacterium]
MFQRMRRGRMGRLLAVSTLAWMVCAYTVMPLAGAFGAARQQGLTVLQAPKFAFPTFSRVAAKPKARSSRTHASTTARPTARTRRHTSSRVRGTRVVRRAPASGLAAPVVQNRYSVAPPSSTTKGAKDPTKGAPVVTDIVGAIPAAPSTDSGTTGQVQGTSAPTGGSTQDSSATTAYGAKASQGSAKATASRAKPVAKAASAESPAAAVDSNTSASAPAGDSVDQTPADPSATQSQPAGGDATSGDVSSGGSTAASADSGSTSTIDGAGAPGVQTYTVSAPATVDNVALPADPVISDQVLLDAGSTLADGVVVEDPYSAFESDAGTVALDTAASVDGVVVEDPYAAFDGAEITPVPDDPALPPCAPAATGGAATAASGPCVSRSGDALAPAAQDASGAGDLQALALASADQPSTTTLGSASARGPPPAGSVLITAAQGGTVTVGAATLTFAPGALARDAYVLMRP